MTGTRGVRTLRVSDAGGNLGIAVSPDGNLFAVSNVKTHSIVVYDVAEGKEISSFGRRGTGPGEFVRPWKMCFNPMNSHLLIADCDNYRVQVCEVVCRM